MYTVYDTTIRPQRVGRRLHRIPVYSGTYDACQRLIARTGEADRYYVEKDSC